MSRRIITALAFAVALCSSTAFAATLRSSQSVSARGAEAVPNAWFVQLKSAPATTANQQKMLASERAAFRQEAKSAGIAFSERYSFDTLWNGLSLEASPGDIKKIRALSSVTAVWPVLVVDAPEVQWSSSPDLFTAITMTGADIAHNELGYTGKGIKVAVMDTGIDVDNPDFGGDGVPRYDSELFPSERVAYGFDFVGDDFNADPDSPTYNPVPVPDANPDDCGGHGSHVAGIVGGNGTIVGVAPEVTFGAYRVFGCDGSTTADIMIAAMEMALKDKMDVLNMSIGSSFQWPQYPTAVAASRLVERGMVVVASIGNSGTSGLYAAGAPGLGEKVIGTASYDNTYVYLPYFEVAGTAIGYVAMTFAGPTPTSGSEVYSVVPNVGCNAADFAGFPAGTSALISRGSCSFGQKASNAINAGASSVVIHNNAPGVFNGTLGAEIDGVTPVVGISQADGELMRAQPAGSSLTWTDQSVSSPNPTGGLISSFSSYGLSPDLALKPDIGAPGGSIYSSYPLELGGHATLSGTSMASPHVAGAAALVLQAKPKMRAADMRDLLQNSADPKPWSGNPGLGFLDMVHRQGAGMVDIDDAILAETLVQPGKIAAGEGEAGPFVQKLTVRNDGGEDVSYALSYVNALSTGGVITPGFFLGSASVAFDQASVMVPAGDRSTFVATITPAASPTFGMYGGYIVLTPDNGGAVLRVPYAGFVGDYQSIQHMSPTANGFPWLAYLDEGEYWKFEDTGDWTFSMQGDDVPYFLVHFDHQVEYFEANIFVASSGRPVHPVFNKGIAEDYLPRNSSTTSFFAFAWDGERIHSNGYNGKGYTKDLTKTVPDGSYVIELRALKANGDRSNPDHWETWTSPEFVIDRP